MLGGQTLTSICLLCYLHLNHWTKFNQIWCVSYSHVWGVQGHNFGDVLTDGVVGVYYSSPGESLAQVN